MVKSRIVNIKMGFDLNTRAPKGSRGKDYTATFKTYVQFLGKYGFLGVLTLSQIRLLIGAGNDYNKLLEIATSEIPPTGVSPLHEVTVTNADFKKWAQAIPSSYLSNTFV